MAIIMLALKYLLGKKYGIDRPAPDPFKVNVQLIFISYKLLNIEIVCH